MSTNQLGLVGLQQQDPPSGDHLVLSPGDMLRKGRFALVYDMIVWLHIQEEKFRFISKIQILRITVQDGDCTHSLYQSSCCSRFWNS